MKIKFLFLSALAVGVAVPAAAQDASPMTGPRVEARLGYDYVSLNMAYQEEDFRAEASDGESGVMYGGEIGYDAAFSKLIVGVYAGLAGSNTESCAEVFGEDEGCLKSGKDITVGARLGTLVAPTTALYIKGGYSNGQIKAEYEDYEDIISDFSASEEIDGFHVGVGVEFAYQSGLYSKLEYVYSNYGEAELRTSDFSAQAGLDRHQVAVGVGVHF